MPTPALEDQKSTEGMVDYSKNSAMQQRLVEHHGDRIRDLVQRLGLVEPELRIVDYGCGPGPSAIDAIAPAIEAYRARFSQGPISVCHADQPGNDWNNLFELATGPSGYRKAAEPVRIEAAVGSFYDQMVAQDSVTLGTCFTASHWLRHAVRLDAPGTVWFSDLKSSVKEELAAVARSDWERFLRCRALELQHGGYLLVSTLGAVPDDGEVNGVAASGRGVYRALQIIAQEMADDGLIDKSVLDSFVFGVWFMTAQEAREPLESDLALAAAFEIEDIRVEPASVNPSDVYADIIDDPSEYARLYVGYARGFGGSTLRKQLFDPSALINSRSGGEADADRLAEEFYRRLNDLYRASPGKYAGETWYLTVVLRRS